MRRAQDIMGMPVIEIETGKRLGTVKDFLIDRDWHLQGVVLEGKHWFSSPRYVPWDEIVSLGEDAVTVNNERSVLSRDEADGTIWLLNGPLKIKGLPVITEDGQQLGLVEDVYLGEQMGRKIVGYELSDGFLSDLTEGRKWLASPDSATIGEDAIIVPADGGRDDTSSFLMKQGESL